MAIAVKGDPKWDEEFKKYSDRLGTVVDSGPLPSVIRTAREMRRWIEEGDAKQAADGLQPVGINLKADSLKHVRDRAEFILQYTDDANVRWIADWASYYYYIVSSKGRKRKWRRRK